MKILTSNITVGKYIIDFLTEIEVVSTWEDLTGTAKIILPENIKWQEKSIYAGTNSIFKPKDEVSISIGYDYQNQTVFEGYLNRVKVAAPLELQCQDKMFDLKNVSIKSYSKKNVTLNSLLSDISPIAYECANINLGKFRIENATVAEVLAEIKKDYGLYAFFRDSKLYVGMPYVLLAKSAKTHKFDLEQNVADSYQLEYVREDEAKIKVKAISINSDNTKTEIEVGDSDGEVRTLHYQDKSQAQLKELAEIDLRKLKYEGFRGSFTAFGEPFVRFGDIVRLSSTKYKDRNGSYLVKAVTYNYGVNGYRQTITLEKKLGA